MNSSKVSNKAFLTGLILGGLATYIPRIHNILDFVTGLFYKDYITRWQLCNISK